MLNTGSRSFPKETRNRKKPDPDLKNTSVQDTKEDYTATVKEARLPKVQNLNSNMFSSVGLSRMMGEYHCIFGFRTCKAAER